MEFFIEFFINVWIELATKIMPKTKQSKKTVFICKLIVVFLILYTIAAFTAGGIMLTNGYGSKAVAMLLMVSAIIICLAQIVLGCIFYIRNSSK